MGGGVLQHPWVPPQLMVGAFPWFDVRDLKRWQLPPGGGGAK